MKPKTPLFNFPVFWKNVTRFSPVWGIYSIILVILLVTRPDSGTANFARSLSYLTEASVTISFIYAACCALCLFGDLFQSRMCNALHAMPLTRDSWFVTNALSGIAFSIIPNFAFCLLCLLGVGSGWLAPLLLFCAMTLHFLFFFGVAVFSVFCAGQRFSALLTYLMINFLSPACLGFYKAIYEPMLNGIETSGDWMMWLCPIAALCDAQYMEIEIFEVSGQVARLYNIHIADGWGYAAICAGLGLLFFLSAFVLYRRRKLEYAGDFIAVKKATGLYLVVFTLAVGLVFFSINESMLLPGCIIGFFGGRMLLDKSLKVFGKRNILSCLALVGALILSFVLTAVDPLGITRWIPEAEDVQSVSIDVPGGQYYDDIEPFAYTDPAEIADFLIIHEGAMPITEPLPDGSYPDTVRLGLDYVLKNGWKTHRVYTLEVNSEAGKLLESYLAQKEQVIGPHAANWEEFAAMVDHLELSGSAYWGVHYYDQVDSLLEAIRLDCEEGNLVQNRTYNDLDNACRIAFVLDRNNPYGLEEDYRRIWVSHKCRHILTWLEENNLYHIVVNN